MSTQELRQIELTDEEWRRYETQDRIRREDFMAACKRIDEGLARERALELRLAKLKRHLKLIAPQCSCPDLHDEGDAGCVRLLAEAALAADTRAARKAGR